MGDSKVTGERGKQGKEERRERENKRLVAYREADHFSHLLAVVIC